MKTKYLSLALLITLVVSLASCNAPEDRSYYEERASKRTDYARVSIGLQKNGSRQFRIVGKNAAVLSGLPGLTKTALIVAVPAGTAHDEDYTAVTNYYDRQLVNLVTSSVTLSLPTDTSLELFEYTFNSTYTLAELTASLKYVAAAATLGPFAISAGTSTVTLSASLFRALSASFSEMLANGSYEISVHNEDGEKVYYYSQLGWNPLTETRYRFDRTLNAFVADTGSDSTDDIQYELIDGTWTAAADDKGAPDSTFLEADYDNYVVYYSNPDFHATLTHIEDLADLATPLDFDGDIIDIPWSSSDAKAYLLEVTEPTDEPYRLEKPEEDHDCSTNTTTQFATLELFRAAKAYDSASNSGPISCKEEDHSTCIYLDSYVPGNTSGTLYEITFDIDNNPSSPVAAGTWQMTTVQTKQLLTYTPDDTGYYYDGQYASFWAELNGLVWRGHYYAAASSATAEPFKFYVVNESAIADFTAYLQSAPAEFFASDFSDGGSCSSGPGIYVGPIQGQGYTSEFDDSTTDSASFQVRLNTQPSSNVTVDVTSDSPWEAVVTSATTLTFSSINWDQDQTVTLAGVNDLIPDGHRMFSLVLTATSSDPEYSSASQSVSIVNVDNDAVVVAGTTYNATQDFWAAMILTDGEMHWDVSFDGASGAEYTDSVAISDFNEIYLAGHKWNGTNNDWWIKKLYGDASEDTTNWNLAFDDSGNDDKAKAVTVDMSNDVYVVGYKNTGTFTDWWIKKFDAAGAEDTTNWNLVFNNATGNQDDIPYAVKIDSTNDVYVIGSTYDISNGLDWWIKKFDPYGIEDTTNWNKQVDGGSFADDEAFDVAFDTSGNIYVVGSMNNGTDLDWLLKKFNSTGVDQAWDATFDGSGGNDTAYSVAIDSASNIYVVGSRFNGTDLDWWIKKFDSGLTEDTTNWNIIDNCGYSGDSVAKKVLIDNNDHLWVFGYCHNGTDYDWRMIQLDPVGNVLLDLSSNQKPGDDYIHSADFYLQ